MRIKENIQKVIDAISAAEKHQFDMAHWTWAIDKEWPVAEATKLITHPYNTCGCIGGWTDAIRLKGKGATQDNGGSVWVGAESYLGLDTAKANKLFFMSGSAYDYADASQQAAITVLTYLKNTGQVDWDLAIEKTTEISE